MTRSDFGRGGLGIYRALLVRPHVARFLFGGVIVQFPYAMVNMALLIGARDGYGSYSSAGVAAATMSIAGAVIGPNIGRAIDRHGQRRVGSIVGAFWIASIGALAAVLVLKPPYWALMGVVIALGASVPGGSLIRARWRVALKSEPGAMPAALSLTSVAEESMWVLSTPIATSLATLVSPVAALAFGVATILGGLHLLLGDATFEPSVHVPRRSSPFSIDEDGALGGETGGAPRLPPDEPAPVKGPSSRLVNPAPGSESGAVKKWPTRTSRERLWTPAFAVLLTVLVFYGAFQSTTGVAIVAFAQEGGAQAWAGAVTACFSGGSMIGALVYGMKDWPGALWARFYLGLGALALSCSGLVLVDSMPTAALVMLVSGLFQAPTVVNINQIFMRIVPASRFTEGMSLFGSMWVIGMSLSNIVAGAAIDRFGSTGGFGTIVGFASAALVLSLVSMPAVRGALRRSPDLVFEEDGERIA